MEIVQYASCLHELCKHMGIPMVLKASFHKPNRIGGNSYPGIGIERGLRILETVKKNVEIPIMTDVYETSQINEVGDVVDVIRVPSFLCRQTDLIATAASVGRIVLLQRGEFASPAFMGQVVERTKMLGNDMIMVCERGIAFGMSDVAFDPRQIVNLREACGEHIPVIADVTHCCQISHARGSMQHESNVNKNMVSVVGRAVAATGVDGIFVECCPGRAGGPIDGSLQLQMEDLRSILEDVMTISRAVNHSTQKYKDK